MILMTDQELIAARLKEARQKLFPDGATDAARSFSWNENTYRSHENGTRGIPRKALQRYAQAFHVSTMWLLEGKESAASSLDSEISRLPEAQQRVVMETVRALISSMRTRGKIS
jgi:hypothetical protein